MITHLKILSTPYYVNHDMSFETKPVCICADGTQMTSRPLLGDLHIAFKASRDSHTGDEIVIMNDLRVWIFANNFAPVAHFTIGEKVTTEDMKQHILDFSHSGDQIEIEYENV